jgi:hypothetical protein
VTVDDKTEASLVHGNYERLLDVEKVDLEIRDEAGEEGENAAS